MHFVKCDILEMHSEQEVYIQINIDKSDINKLIILLLKLAFRKQKQVILYDELNNINAIIKYSNCYSITLNNKYKEHKLSEEQLNLLYSFLLDNTEDYAKYNHIDIEIYDEGKIYNYTISVNSK